jgi:hypothetical protein
MLMSYIGTLESVALSSADEHFWHGPDVLRLPMLLAGVASVWLFFRLLSASPAFAQPSLDAHCWRRMQPTS